jgi:hypothetical protein
VARSPLETAHTSAQVLGHDQVGTKLLHQGRVDGVERTSLFERRAYRRVDLPARQRGRVDPRRRDDRLAEDLCGPAALVGDAHE